MVSIDNTIMTLLVLLTQNRRAMNRDPDIYGADAHEFNPSRHLDSEGKIKTAIVDTKEESHSKLLVLFLKGDEFTDGTLVTYGFGRRICPGRYGLFSCTPR